jgi:hypothetical protein
MAHVLLLLHQGFGLRKTPGVEFALPVTSISHQVRSIRFGTGAGIVGRFRGGRGACRDAFTEETRRPCWGGHPRRSLSINQVGRRRAPRLEFADGGTCHGGGCVQHGLACGRRTFGDSRGSRRAACRRRWYHRQRIVNMDVGRVVRRLVSGFAKQFLATSGRESAVRGWPFSMQREATPL